MARPSLLLTRPAPSATRFAETLDPRARAAVDIVIAPLMEIVARDTAFDLQGIAGVIFTSANGVGHAPRGEGRPAYCVGSRTTALARASGWQAQQAGENAQELIAALRASPPPGPLLHLGGAHTIGDIAQNLGAAGIETRHVALYTQELLRLSREAREALGRPCIVPVFSPRTAQQLAKEAHGHLTHAHLVALSPAVASPLAQQRAASLHILPTPQAQGMRIAVENLCLSSSLA